MRSRGKVEQFDWCRKSQVAGDAAAVLLSSGIALDVILNFIPKILLEEREEKGKRDKDTS